jgi:glycosyltransferase involved in cell wall biosynthesis
MSAIARSFDTARVSVVIPCYRDSATLARALASLESQTRRADEVIVVDDCSPEGEMIQQVIAGFPGTKYVRNAENLGLAGTRNRGLQEATGDIVAFLDADDEAHPQRIDWQLRFVAPDTAVACDVVRVPAGGCVDNALFDWPPSVTTYRHVGRMIYANRLTGASLMAPAALLRAAGGYDSSLRSCEDFDLWLRLLGGGYRVQRIRRPLYIYHQNPAGLSRRFQDIARWELAVVEKFIASGGNSSPGGLRTGTIWATWLMRHFARASIMSDPILRRQAGENLVRLDRWPALKWLVRAIACSGVLKLWQFAWRTRA